MSWTYLKFLWPQLIDVIFMQIMLPLSTKGEMNFGEIFLWTVIHILLVILAPSIFVWKNLRQVMYFKTSSGNITALIALHCLNVLLWELYTVWKLSSVGLYFIGSRFVYNPFKWCLWNRVYFFFSLMKTARCLGIKRIVEIKTL